MKLVQCLTERDGVRTPDIPGRSTPHTPGLAGLDALQEVVVLLLLAGLLRPVEEVVLGYSDFIEFIIARPRVLPCLVIQPDPRKEAISGQNVVEFRIMEDNSVVKTGVQVEHGVIEAACLVCSDFLGICVGVAHPEYYVGHVAAPEASVHQVLLDGGVEGDGVLAHTGSHISTQYYSECHSHSVIVS